MSYINNFAKSLCSTPIPVDSGVTKSKPKLLGITAAKPLLMEYEIPCLAWLYSMAGGQKIVVYPEVVNPVSQLNGANGEVTGTDDMKHSAVKTLRACYTNPFSEEAEGATILDEYQQPVSARKSHITSTVSSSSGNFSLTFFPNPCLSAVNMETGPVLSWGGQGSFTISTSIRYVMTNVQLYDTFIEYRVVGGGLRVRNLMTPLNATGRLEVVQVPVTKPGINYAAAETINIGADQVAEWCLGKIPTSAGRFASFLSMPGADEYTADELMKNDLIIPFKVNGPDYYKFRSTVADERSANYLPSDTGQFIDSATGAVVTTSSYAAAGVTDASGMNAILLRGTGFPTTGSILEIEMILHIEGIPFTNSTTAIFAPAVAERKTPDPLAQQKLIAEACARPDSSLMSQVRAHAVDVFKGIRDGVRNREPRGKINVPRKAASIVTNRVINSAFARLGLAPREMKKHPRKKGRKTNAWHGKR